MISYKDNIQVTSTTTGTGTLTQAAAVTGFAAPASGDDGKTFTIMVKGVDGSGIPTGEWELCESTYTHSGTTWSRGTLLDSSTGSRVTFSAGTKHIAVVFASPQIIDSRIYQSEISITGATTATIGRYHVCSGTTADYTVTLPASSGNAGRMITLRMAPALTKLVTVDASGSELIDGALSRAMWANESATLLCDGTGWTKIGGKSIPMMAKIRLTATSQTLSAGVGTEWKDFDSNGVSEVFDVGDIMDGTTGANGGRVTIRRSAKYNIFGALGNGDVLSDGEAIYMRILSDPSGSPSVLLYEYRIAVNPPVSYMRFNCAGSFPLTAGTVVAYTAFRSVSGNLSGSDSITSWGLQEIPEW